MSTVRNHVEELRWRGLLHDSMPGTEDYLLKGPASGYIGFDPTADSLHVGNMVQIMMLKHFQESGHRPIALVGGATGMVGDPSGKKSERNLLDVADLSSDMKRLRELFALFEQKTSLMQLLDVSNRAEGVQIYIGGESGIAPLDECSVVTSSYEIDGKVVGSIGVIGPTRMAYERMIPIVDITAKLLSSALSSS